MTSILIQRKKKLEKISRTIVLSLLVALLTVAGNISCTRQVDEGETPQDEATMIIKGINEFEGVVKVGVGRYFFIPGAQGIDMVIQGQTESGDASTLVDKEVKVRGEFSPERPSILTVETVDIKEDEKQWRNIYTRTEDWVLEDYLDSKNRDKYKILKNLRYNKKEDWEGKGERKVYGKLERTTITEDEEEKDVYKVILIDESGKETGKILVDNITDYALYYLKKLRLFDNFWFYINIKETVDWRIRRKARELFHADVLFAGLF